MQLSEDLIGKALYWRGWRDWGGEDNTGPMYTILRQYLSNGVWQFEDHYNSHPSQLNTWHQGNEWEFYSGSASPSHNFSISRTKRIPVYTGKQPISYEKLFQELPILPRKIREEYENERRNEDEDECRNCGYTTDRDNLYFSEWDDNYYCEGCYSEHEESYNEEE